MDRRFPLVEIFHSLQGEGRNAGRQCAFVRFAGCNFDCPWCDTPREARFAASAAEIVAELARHPSRSVILTGGEPTAVEGAGELAAALRSAGFWIGVETNGSCAAPWLDAVDYVACSPKAEYPDRIDLSKAGEVRIVASSEDIVDFCRAVESRIKAADYYISPCDRGGSIDFAAAKSVLSRLPNWSLSVQLHKILGFR